MIVDEERRTQISAANLRIPPYGILDETNSPTDCHDSNVLNLESVSGNSNGVRTKTNSNNCIQSNNLSG